MASHPSGRSYFRVYRSRRDDEVDFLIRAIERSGGRCLAHSGGSFAPLHVVFDDGDGRLTGALVYVFSAGHSVIRNRPADEHRLQIKYGDITEAFRQEAHGLGFDPVGLEVTMVLAVHAQANLVIALDPLLYDPLPMGIQVGLKAAEVERAQTTGWHVWERLNRPGRRRDTRAHAGLETIVAFAPDRFIDFVAFERQAQTMGLDPALRFKAAEAAADRRATVHVHDLEQAYSLGAREILEIVSQRSRLATALRGGVAEHHLHRQLSAMEFVAAVRPGTQDGPPDFLVELSDGRELSVECKNASPRTYADGAAKVEIQKTRASKGDPLSRLYPVDAFDAVAVCMYGPRGVWDFRFRLAADLARHPEHPERIAPLQRVDDSWSAELLDVASQ